jgi:uncharacterized protein
LFEVVSNTSPLQYLHQLSLLELLPRLVGGVLVPPAVLEELEAGRRLGINVPDLSACPWVEVRRPAAKRIAVFPYDLGAGESESLHLALEMPNSVVLLDDGLARRTAEMLKLRFTGTLGILLDAKRVGMIPRLSPFVVQLEELGFRLSARTKEAVLRLAKELSP